MQIPMSHVTSVIDGLKKLYIEKLKPLEVTYQFNDFVTPLLVSLYIHILHLDIGMLFFELCLK